MRRRVAQLLIRMGTALFVMAVVVRFDDTTRASRVGDDLALVASAAVVVVGAVFARFGRD